MAHGKLLLALSVIAAATPVWAASDDRPRPATAPPGTAETRYCMWMAATTGTLIDQVKCWTREQWARQGVDVDKDWAKEGVRIYDGRRAGAAAGGGGAGRAALFGSTYGNGLTARG